MSPGPRGAGRLAPAVVAAGYAAGWRLVRSAPYGIAAAAFRLGADVCFRAHGRGVTQLAENLRRVVPTAGERELAALTRDAMRSYARYWLETFRFPDMDPADVESRTPATGIDNVHRALSDGRGVVIALPHMGNYDAAGVWLMRHCGTFTTVVERLEPESVFRRFVSYRERLGMEVLAVGGGEPSPTSVLTRRLRENRILCLVADRDLAGGGVPVTFFGEPARMPAGPAFLAANTGAALIPVGLWFEESGWGLRFYPEVPLAAGARLRDRVAAMTQSLADVFAGDIAAHPQDWHMLQPVWTR